jgi:nitrile hydratase beta subunit
LNGVHDMGGMQGFGPVVPEPDEPVFHARWEGRVYALTRAMGFAGLWNIDMSRATQARLPAPVYLSVSYYKRWMLGLEQLLLKHELIEPEEIAAGHMLHAGKLLKRRLAAAAVDGTLSRGSFSRPAQAPARFVVGARIRTRNFHPETHTRLPRYARGRFGVIERIQGCHVFPDSVTTGAGEDPQWLYTVRFEGHELWGESADPKLTVSIEAFEPYLEPA